MEIVKIFFYSKSKEDKNGIWKFFNKMESNVFDQVGMNECIYICILRSRIFKFDFLGRRGLNKKKFYSFFILRNIYNPLIKFIIFNSGTKKFLFSHLLFHTK